MDYKAHKYIQRFCLRKILERLNMAFLKLNFCMVVISVMCTIDSAESNKIRMLESGFNMMRENLSDLELKVFSDELEIRNELKQIRGVLSNFTEGFKNNQTVNLDIVVDTIKKLEERSRIITNGFTGEKENLREQVAEFENEIEDFRNQHFDFVGYLEQMKNEMKQLGEELKSDSKTFSDRISTELRRMQGELDTTGRKTKQLDSVVNEMKNKIHSFYPELQNVCTSDDSYIYENSCYIYFESQKSWIDASTHCSNLGGYLAEINSYSENQFLTETYKDKQETWLGGSDMATESVWRWTSTNELYGYENWNSGEPNDLRGNEDCMDFNPKIRSGKWNDFNCSYNFKFLCEFSLNISV